MKTAAKMQGRYRTFSRRGHRRPFGARTISCQRRSPILAPNFFWGNWSSNNCPGPFSKFLRQIFTF